jgi:hypothetical protein
MVAQLHDSAMDAAYDIVDNANAVYVITAYSLDTTRATVITTPLATVAMTPTSDYTKADGDAGNGSRKVTMAAKNAVSVGNSGTATHVALVDATNVLLVTTCTSQALTSGNTVNIPAWKHEFGIPT